MTHKYNIGDKIDVKACEEWTFKQDQPFTAIIIGTYMDGTIPRYCITSNTPHTNVKISFILSSTTTTTAKIDKVLATLYKNKGYSASWINEKWIIKKITQNNHKGSFCVSCNFYNEYIGNKKNYICYKCSNNI